MTRFGYVMVTYFSVMGIAIASFAPVSPCLVWNASASIPIGLYDLAAPGDLKVGDLVAVMPEKPLADFIVERGYIGRDVPMMKHVAALPDEEVCRTGRDIMINGTFAGSALDRDGQGRELPVWQGCRRIADGELFLMNPSVPDSLDGRYFGPSPQHTVIGKATALYTDVNGDGHFVWHSHGTTTPRAATPR